MVENYQRSQGQPKSFKTDKGGAPAETGPFLGEITNNVDPTRSGRPQVYIEYLAGSDKTEKSLWRTVSYISPMYGTTQQSAPQTTGPGSFTGNQQSYGFWGTPPDIGTKVICFFANGDPNMGYYIGAPIDPGINHMMPAIGASKKYTDDTNSPYFAGATQLPVTEVNNSNPSISENPRFFEESKPVHSVLAGQMLDQGVISDPLLGPITSNSQRESPSTVYGWSSPGRPVYKGGFTPAETSAKVSNNQVKANEVQVISRLGGHSIVMDDGDLDGQDQLLRLRTASGHQVMLNDTGDTIHIMHANGQSWVELGKEGTLDVYASNSVNIRSQGEINMHASGDININSEKGSIKMFAKLAMGIETKALSLNATDNLLLYSRKQIGIKSDGNLALKSKNGSWNSGSLTFVGKPIKLNSGAASDVPTPQDIPKNKLPDTTFKNNVGWVIEKDAIESVVSRAPTHEPYPFHSTGVNSTASLSGGASEVPTAVNTQAAIAKADSVSVSKITVSDYEVQDGTATAVGKLTPSQVQAMLAQASKQVPQDFTAISDTLGVGKFGFSAQQLENAGYLKPGTSDFFLNDPSASITSVLNNGSVWTGVNGVSNINDFLSNQNLQDVAQTDLLNTGLSALQNLGVVTGLENSADLAGLVQGAAKFGGPAVAKWVDGAAVLGKTFSGLDSSAISSLQMDEIVQGGKYAVDLVLGKIPSSLQGFTSIGSDLASLANFDISKVASLSDLAGLGNLTSIASLGNVTSIASLGSTVAGVFSGGLGSIFGGLFGGGGGSYSFPAFVNNTVVEGITNATNRIAIDNAVNNVVGSFKVQNATVKALPLNVLEYQAALKLMAAGNGGSANSVIKSIKNKIV